jgi:hypothetical protein
VVLSLAPLASLQLTRIAEELEESERHNGSPGPPESVDSEGRIPASASRSTATALSGFGGLDDDRHSNVDDSSSDSGDDEILKFYSETEAEELAALARIQKPEKRKLRQERAILRCYALKATYLTDLPIRYTGPPAVCSAGAAARFSRHVHALGAVDCAAAGGPRRQPRRRNLVQGVANVRQQLA